MYNRKNMIVYTVLLLNNLTAGSLQTSKEERATFNRINQILTGYLQPTEWVKEIELRHASQETVTAAAWIDHNTVVTGNKQGALRVWSLHSGTLHVNNDTEAKQANEPIIAIATTPKTNTLQALIYTISGKRTDTKDRGRLSIYSQDLFPLILNPTILRPLSNKLPFVPTSLAVNTKIASQPLCAIATRKEMKFFLLEFDESQTLYRLNCIDSYTVQGKGTYGWAGRKLSSYPTNADINNQTRTIRFLRQIPTLPTKTIQQITYQFLPRTQTAHTRIEDFSSVGRPHQIAVFPTKARQTTMFHNSPKLLIATSHDNSEVNFHDNISSFQDDGDNIIVGTHQGDIWVINEETSSIRQMIKDAHPPLSYKNKKWPATIILALSPDNKGLLSRAADSEEAHKVFIWKKKQPTSLAAILATQFITGTVKPSA